MSDKYSGDIDPEIAALLNADGPPGGAPNFDDLFSAGGGGNSFGGEPADFSKKGFPPVKEFFESPKPYFTNPKFYNVVLADLGDPAARVHQILTDLMNAPDPETRGQARLRFTPAWWTLLEALVRDISSAAPEPKRLAVRYGVLLPSLLAPEQRDILASIIYDNRTGEAVHYIDEWMRKVGSGEVAPLATDEEIKVVKKGSADNTANIQRLEKVQGQYQAQTNLINVKFQEVKELEALIAKNSLEIGRHDAHPMFTNLADVFNSTQKSALFGIQEAMKSLSALDKEIALYFRDLEKMKGDLTRAEAAVNESGGVTVDTKAVVRELNSIRQMAKLSVGRQGNHFPVLMKQYMPGRIDDIATRENVLSIMSEVERLDPGIFIRMFKGTSNRIVPHLILFPSFGELGVCWEPFEKFNRSTSRGRIGIPMYSKSVKNAVLTGLADFRWQVVKEKAGYRWMEEGLTGWYYQQFTDSGGRGDVREYFIQDYILWITKESEGTQKLDKEVRGIFWRNMPFPPEIREILRNRGFVYSELYKKDLNRAMSDGY
ncbi:MAG: hypothetical protein WCG80_03840 [Spirochaetales bacterium]